MSWLTKLKQGYLFQAYQDYLATEENDRIILNAFEDLQSMRNAMRAKYWQKAFNIIEARLDSPDFIDWQQLEREIIALQDIDSKLDRLQVDEAISKSKEIRLELLNAEKATLLGRAQIFNNELDKARASFASALEYDPKHYRAITNLGNLELEQGNFDSAIEYYDNALTISPDFTNALHNIGVAYRRKGQFTKSVRYLRRAQGAMRRADKEEARGALSNRKLGQQALRFQRFFWFALAGGLLYYFFFRA